MKIIWLTYNEHMQCILTFIKRPHCIIVIFKSILITPFSSPSLIFIDEDPLIEFWSVIFSCAYISRNIKEIWLTANGRKPSCKGFQNRLELRCYLRHDGCIRLGSFRVTRRLVNKYSPLAWSSINVRGTVSIIINVSLCPPTKYSTSHSWSTLQVTDLWWTSHVNI